jgi:hypothetical protein
MFGLVGFHDTIPQADYAMGVVGNVFLMGNQYHGIAIFVDFTEDVHDLV